MATEGKLTQSSHFGQARDSVSGLGQVDAPKRCLSTDRASAQSFADDRPCQTQQPNDDSEKTTRSIEKIRQKRLRRNKKKREQLKKLPRKKFAKDLRDQLHKAQKEHRKEKRLSAFCWTRLKEVEKINTSLRLYRYCRL